MDRQTRWLPPLPASEPLREPLASPPQPSSSPLRRALGPLFVAGALIVKFGKIALLLLTKAKFLTTSLSMLVSVAAYSLVWGWKFALGFVGLLFCHEMGHYIQLRREGVKPSGMLFIPFLGAVVGARSLGGSALAEARVGLAGPVLGTLACFALVPIAVATGEDFWRALIFTGLFLNLLNLIPVVPLDGGRAMAAMAPAMWFAGFAGIVVLFLIAHSPILVLILVFGGLESWRRFKGRRSGEEGNAAYYEVKPAHRLLVGLVYVALIAVLAVGMDLSFVDHSARF